MPPASLDQMLQVQLNQGPSLYTSHILYYPAGAFKVTSPVSSSAVAELSIWYV